VDEKLPSFAFDASPRSEQCEKCGAGTEADLRFVILRGRERYVGRTLCNVCAEEALEKVIGA
jgi:hypothetical protein